VDISFHRREIDMRLAGIDTETRAAACLVCRPRCANERLARHAARPGAIAADALAFDQRRSRAQFGGKIRRDQTARPCADDDDIIMMIRWCVVCALSHRIPFW